MMNCMVQPGLAAMLIWSVYHVCLTTNVTETFTAHHSQFHLRRYLTLAMSLCCFQRPTMNTCLYVAQPVPYFTYDLVCSGAFALRSGHEYLSQLKARRWKRRSSL